jgi:hypothetical protein
MGYLARQYQSRYPRTLRQVPRSGSDHRGPHSQWIRLEDQGCCRSSELALSTLVLGSRQATRSTRMQKQFSGRNIPMRHLLPDSRWIRSV